MRILLIGATGTIGKAIAATLGGRHEVLLASRQQAPLRVAIANPPSSGSLYAKVGKVGAVISAAGQTRCKPFDELSDADFRFSVDNKLMGQVNLVRYGLASVVDGGSITITSGVLAQQPSRGSARSEEHTSELQSPCNLVCRLLLEKKKKNSKTNLQTKIYHNTDTKSTPHI